MISQLAGVPENIAAFRAMGHVTINSFEQLNADPKK